MKVMCLAVVLAIGTLSVPAFAQDAAPGARSVQELLRLVEQGIARDQQEARERIRRFEQERGQQEARLNEARAELRRLESSSAALEGRFQNNETALVEAEARLTERLGTLKELFGVLQQTAGDFRGNVQSSLISGEYPGREAFLTSLIEKAGSSSKLPTITEIEQLWFEMQREMTASGVVSRFSAPLVDPDGRSAEAEVTRVGAFNAIANGRYVIWQADTGSLVELAKQPAGRYTGVAADFERSSAPVADFWLDPSRGSILSLIIQSPSLGQRIDQGGLVGYAIIALGLIGLLIALERLVSLSVVDRKVSVQLKQPGPNANNPLGRVMAAYEQFKTVDRETLELKLAEAIAQETPSLQRFLALLKIIGVVAPLLGLLGTVTGMINTFQAITLFGTGDPKMMAGGISQALVTTVLGLVVAIPIVLLHTLVSSRSKRIAQVIEERAIGVMAEHSEATRGHAG